MTRGVNEGGRCICRRCGNTFSSLSAFDAHQRSIDVHPWVMCMDPFMVVKKDGSPRLRFDNGVWKSAEINDRWQR